MTGRNLENDIVKPHLKARDPHPQYVLKSDVSGGGGTSGGITQEQLDALAALIPTGGPFVSTLGVFDIDSGQFVFDIDESPVEQIFA